MRVFRKEISIWIFKPSKADWPPKCGQASSNPWKDWIEQKEGKREIPLSSRLSWDISLLLSVWDLNTTDKFSILGLLDLD